MRLQIFLIQFLSGVLANSDNSSSSSESSSEMAENSTQPLSALATNSIAGKMSSVT